jgi:hypothetical protein
LSEEVRVAEADTKLLVMVCPADLVAVPVEKRVDFSLRLICLQLQVLSSAQEAREERALHLE